jgi:hypothetical protein
MDALDDARLNEFVNRLRESTIIKLFDKNVRVLGDLLQRVNGEAFKALQGALGATRIKEAVAWLKDSAEGVCRRLRENIEEFGDRIVKELLNPPRAAAKGAAIGSVAGPQGMVIGGAIGWAGEKFGWW